MEVKLEDIVQELWLVHNEMRRRENESNIGAFAPGINLDKSKTVLVCLERIVKKFGNN